MPRLPLPLSGKLERHGVAAVLRAVLASRRDGCLTVSRGGITRRLYLRGGMIVYGTSTERQDRLGEILIAQGKLSREDHRAYWEISRSEGRRLGQTLVVTGRITPHDLYQGVTAQVVTILERLQKWRSGEYAFEEGADPEPGTALLCIPLALFLRAERPLPAGRGTTPAEPGAPAKRGGKRGGRAKAAAAPRAAAAPEDEEEITILAEEGAIAVPSRQEAEEQVRLGEVSFLVQELRSRLDQGPRALLGVPPDAPRAAVRQAFERIARVLRAERVPARAPAELAREAAELLRTVAAAAEAVEAEAKAPPAPAATPRAAPSAEEQARRLFAQGREFVARRNYWQAADALRQAVRLRPEDPLLRQYLALALLQIRRHQEAEEHLHEAIRLEPGNAAHWVNLGRVYKGGRLFAKARQSFERALRLDPRNEHAREEQRDLPEEAPAPRAAGGSILRKLFGKG